LFKFACVLPMENNIKHNYKFPYQTVSSNFVGSPASQHPGQEFWLGADDQMVEGVWSWYTDNSSLTYAGW